MRPDAAGFVVQRLENSHVLSRKGEIEHIDILADAGRRSRFRDRDQAIVEMPAQDDLSRGLAVFTADPGKGLVRHQSALPEGAPGLGGDPVLRMKGAQLSLLEAGMQLDLVE